MGHSHASGCMPKLALNDVQAVVKEIVTTLCDDSGHSAARNSTRKFAVKSKL